MISPIHLVSNISELDDEYDYNSYLLSKEGKEVYKGLAKDFNTLFLDASIYAKPGIDGEHLDEDGHFNLGMKIIELIEELWK